jgi:hypothetical protein
LDISLNLNNIIVYRIPAARAAELFIAGFEFILYYENIILQIVKSLNTVSKNSIVKAKNQIKDEKDMVLSNMGTVIFLGIILLPIAYIMADDYLKGKGAFHMFLDKHKKQ